MRHAFDYRVTAGPAFVVSALLLVAISVVLLLNGNAIGAGIAALAALPAISLLRLRVSLDEAGFVVRGWTGLRLARVPAPAVAKVQRGHTGLGMRGDGAIGWRFTGDRTLIVTRPGPVLSVERKGGHRYVVSAQAIPDGT